MSASSAVFAGICCSDAACKARRHLAAARAQVGVVPARQQRRGAPAGHGLHASTGCMCSEAGRSVSGVHKPVHLRGPALCLDCVAVGSQVYQEAEGPEGQGGAIMVSAVVRSTPSAAFHVCAHTSLAKCGQSMTLIVVEDWRVYRALICTARQRPGLQAVTDLHCMLCRGCLCVMLIAGPVGNRRCWTLARICRSWAVCKSSRAMPSRARCCAQSCQPAACCNMCVPGRVSAVPLLFLSGAFVQRHTSPRNVCQLGGLSLSKCPME